MKLTPNYKSIEKKIKRNSLTSKTQDKYKKKSSSHLNRILKKVDTFNTYIIYHKFGICSKSNNLILKNLAINYFKVGK